MKPALWCLAFGILPLPGQVAALAVYTEFQHTPNAAVVDSMHAEVDSIILPLGLGLEWRSLDGHGDQVSGELAVVSFKGTCDSGAQPSHADDSRSLGWTHISDGQILPFTDVDCDRIRAFVRTRINGSDPNDRDRLLGRAVGRVLAHELYHILARRSHHGSGSVDRPEYASRDLVSDDFQLQETECRILQLVNSGAIPSGIADIEGATGSAKQGEAKFLKERCSVCHGPRGQGTRNGPPLRKGAHAVSPVVLAAQLGIDSVAMCRRAKQLKLPPLSISAGDLPDLVRFLNGLL
uniref:Cytochrome c domain-containing protein n=1 Tax=Solibacter usitatus (strain Ellin6076) TaxID=234267 RepID=Q01ZN0_SOLUE